jgi:hypothetical protein
MHDGTMNSKNTTFPRKDDKEIFCPVNPLEFTTGRVKSGAVPLCTGGGVGCESEYAAQITITRTTAMTIFSPQLKPFFLRFTFERADMVFHYVIWNSLGSLPPWFIRNITLLAEWHGMGSLG